MSQVQVSSPKASIVTIFLQPLPNSDNYICLNKDEEGRRVESGREKEEEKQR